MQTNASNTQLPDAQTGHSNEPAPTFRAPFKAYLGWGPTSEAITPENERTHKDHPHWCEIEDADGHSLCNGHFGYEMACRIADALNAQATPRGWDKIDTGTDDKRTEARTVLAQLESIANDVRKERAAISELCAAMDKVLPLIDPHHAAYHTAKAARAAFLAEPMPSTEEDDTERRLAAFGRAVLKVLESEEEWNAGTIDDVAAEAYNRNLAHNEPDQGYFRSSLPK